MKIEELIIDDKVEFIDKTPGQYSHDSIYLYKGLCRVKNPDTGKWFDAVLYSKISDKTIFVREKTDFENKFKKV